MQKQLNVHSRYCREFAAHHNLTFETIFEPELPVLDCAIEAFFDHNRQIEENVGKFKADKNLTHQYLTALYQRVYEQFAACAVCYFAGTWASVEVLARVVLESAANTIYITREPIPRLPQYLAHFFVSEEAKVEKQRYYGRTLSADEEDAIKAAIAHGQSNLAKRKAVIELILKNDGLPPMKIGGWPDTTFALFQAIGWEGVYRHTYSTLSSQVHNDADGLVDYITTIALSALDPSSLPAASEEVRLHVVYRLHNACSALLDATIATNAALGLNQSIAEGCIARLKPMTETLVEQFASIARKGASK